MYEKCRRIREIDTAQYDVTVYIGKSDVILGIELSILEDDISVHLERIESNKPCYTKPNMISTSLCHIGYLSINQRRRHFRTLSASRITNLIIQP